jgi:hypothetical protein
VLAVAVGRVVAVGSHALTWSHLHSAAASLRNGRFHPPLRPDAVEVTGCGPVVSHAQTLART